ncbi:MAG: kinesin-like protein [Satyrvirus sp.]|uniref:Kinesin-like protein n=1 Tax=Satyrvirus sp. TaxID=2487771 RepID=A0A3G5AD34_9VIRU|nr:MAG: kinesin-like protein [Satyrvirus sp.]
MVSISVYSDYTKKTLDPTTQIVIDANKVSHYHMDYILMHFNEMVAREIDENRDIIYNPFFQNLMKWVTEYRRILDEARTSEEGIAKGPDGIEKVYDCAKGGDHKYASPVDVSVEYVIKHATISPTSLHPNIYYDFVARGGSPANWQDVSYTVPKIFFPGSTTLKTFNTTETYFGYCGVQLRNVFFMEIIPEMNNAWNLYQVSKFSPSIEKTNKDMMEKMYKDYELSMAITNDAVKNGDYAIRYTVIEEKLKDSVRLLEELSAAADTEENIIQMGADISNYYEKLSFRDSDIDPALEIPVDTNDLIDSSIMAAQRKKELDLYNKLPSSNIFANVYNLGTNVSGMANAAQFVNKLSTVIKSSMNIQNVSLELNELLNTKIYKDAQNRQIAKYLTPLEEEQLIKDELAKQKNYLDRFDTTGAILVPGTPDSAKNRLEAYDENYKYKKIAGGSNGSNIKYGFEEYPKKIRTVSQSGGRYIKMSQLLESSKESQNTVNKVIGDVNKIETEFVEQDKLYFENKYFFDIEGLQQRNEFLIEMMNIIIIYIFLIKEKGSQHQKVFEEINDKIKDFKDNLVKMWDILRSDVSSTPPDIDTIINNFMSHGSLTMTQAQDIIARSGIMPDVSKISNNAMINSMPMVKLLSALVNKYSVSNMNLVANDLKKIMTARPVTTTEKEETVQQHYQNMYQFYSHLKSLNASLNSEFKNLDANSLDYNKIIQFTGNIIERNIETANIFIREIIAVVQNFGNIVLSLQTIREEMAASKRRFNDFQTNMKQSIYELSTREGVIEKKHVDFVKGPTTTVVKHNFDDLEDFYKNYVDEYGKKLSDASDNVVRHFNYEKDIQYVSTKVRMLEKTRDEFNVFLDIMNNFKTMYVEDPRSISYGNIGRILKTYITKLTKSKLYLYENLMKRINVPSEMNQLFGLYLYSDVEHTEEVLDYFFKFDIKNNLIPSPGYDKREQIQMALRIADNYIKLANVIKKSYKPTTTLKYDEFIVTKDLTGVKRTVNADKAIEAIKYVVNEYSKDYADIKLQNLVVLLFKKVQQYVTFKIDIDSNNNIKTYIDTVAQLKGLDITKLKDRKIMKKYIIDQMNTVTISLFNLFNEKLITYYYLLNNLVLENAPRNPFFDDIKIDQNKVSKFRTNSRKMEQYVPVNNLVNNFASISNDYIARKDPAFGVPLTGDFFVNEEYLGDYFFNIFNTINENTFFLYILISDHTNINDHLTNVYDYYRNFWNTSNSALMLMESMINAGEDIKPSKDITITDYELISNSNGMSSKIKSPISYSYDVVVNPFVNGISSYTYDVRVGYIIYNDYYPLKPYIISFIPSALHNTLVYDASITTYKITPILGETIILFNNTNNEYKIPKKIEITAGAPVTLEQIDIAIKILNTGKYIINYLNKLRGLLDKFHNKTYTPEDPLTRDSSVQLSNPLYATRNDRKIELIPILNILAEIEADIKNNIQNSYYLNTLLIKHFITDISNHSIVYLAAETRDMLQTMDPQSDVFNTKIDLVWLFAAKLTTSWFSLLAHMYSEFQLNLSIEKIKEIVEILQPLLDPSIILNIAQYNPYVGKLDDYTKKVNGELVTNGTNFTNKRNDYPIETDKAKIDPKDPDKRLGKYVIDENIKDKIEFCDYYTNINTNSKDIYVIMILMKKDVSQRIKEALVDISTECINIMNLDIIIRKLVSKNTFKNLCSLHQISKIYANDPNWATIMKEHLDAVAQGLFNTVEADFRLYKLDHIFGKLKTHFSKYNQKFVHSFVDSFDPNGPVADIPAELISNNFQYTNTQYETSGPFDVNLYEEPYHRAFYDYNNDEPGSLEQLNNLYLTDLYSDFFIKVIKKHIINVFKKIKDSMDKIKSPALFEIILTVGKYYRTTKIAEIFDPAEDLFTDVGFHSGPNDDNDKIKFILVYGSEYKDPTSAKLIENINDVVSNISSMVSPDLHIFYEGEINNYRNLINENLKLLQNIRDIKKNIFDKNNSLRRFIDTISQVMFLPDFKKFAIVVNNKILELAMETVSNYETIWRIIRQKLNGIINKSNKHLLNVAQVNSFIAFVGAIGKSINGKDVVDKFYAKLSFGLVEFYKEIIDNILDCIEGDNKKPYDQMSMIERYLYTYHYIQLKRCNALFTWIRNEYQNKKMLLDLKELKKDKKYNKLILKHKIILEKTKNDALLIFGEFNGLRRLLDEYNAVVMDKVQLHLRINDFSDPKENKKIEDNPKYIGDRSKGYLLDYDATSIEYKERWDTKRLVFVNDNNNKLFINFEILENIYKLENPGNPVKDFSLYYSAIHDKMINGEGIKFQRIYNTLTYPESDIISSYMSIAPNINNNRGTVLMTYGYSGVGKSRSLFGGPAEPERGVLSPTDGILQRTLDQLSNVEIYFRVYEIYGLGLQYNYYWNPIEANNYKCFPEFYQCVIHHIIKTDNPVLDIVNEPIVLVNRHDILSYILDLKNPETSTGFKIEDKQEPNLLKRQNYFPDPTNVFTNPGAGTHSTYVKINQDHYKRFGEFQTKVDKQRQDNGITIKNLFEHKITQIKGTINNPVSSRSILVYDFEIKIANNTFIPFLIYDLPGKEDLYRTYVQTNVQSATGADPKMLERVFKDIPEDGPLKEKKSTYILNPILAPIFSDGNVPNVENVEKIIDLLTNISSSPPGANPVALDSAFEAALITDILQYDVNSFNYVTGADPDYKEYNETGPPFKMETFYDDPINGGHANIDSFADLLKFDNIKILDDTDFYNTIALEQGVLSPGQYWVKKEMTKAKNEIMVLIIIVVIAHIIKYKLFDLLTEIINVVVGDGDNSRNGGWSKNKIYAFYEAYYINENVVGLLQYLVSNILEIKDTGIVEQSTVDEDMGKTVDKNYKTAMRFRTIKSLEDIGEPETIDMDYGFIVTNELLTDDDPLKKMEIAEFIDQNNVDPNTGEFVEVYMDTTSDVYERMKNVVSFENRGKYDTNRIFRKGDKECNQPSDKKYIINPFNAININLPEYTKELNYPLLKDFIEPYSQKISFYYVFYVLSNSRPKDKAEEQVKLLNNSMPFIVKMDPGTKKKKTCAQ